MSGRSAARTDGSAVTRNLRPFAALGILAPIGFWIVVVVLGALTPGYSAIEDPISGLGAVGAPYAIVQQANFVFLGIGVLAFAYALDRHVRTGARPWLGVVLVALLGLFGAIGSGVFPSSPANRAALTETLHTVSVIIGFHAALIGIPLTTRTLARSDRWPAYRGRSTVLGISLLVVGAYIVFLLVGIRVDGFGGAAQRLYAGVLTGWIAVHSFILYRDLGTDASRH